MLARVDAFTAPEVACALELVDLALERPDQPDYHFLVAIDDALPGDPGPGGVLAGYICYGPTPMTEGTWDLYWVAANPDLKGKGVGSQLVAAMEADLKGRKARMVRVETSAQEAYGPTRGFYAKNRYAESARLKDFYRDGDDLVILSKRLDR